MELEKKTMEIIFSNPFLQYFQNISILWKSSNCSSAKPQIVTKSSEFRDSERPINAKQSLTYRNSISLNYPNPFKYIFFR